MEIPEELADTFRLLSRFGTRLRARHGNGTRRHIKLDEFKGSLYSNIKLPGDTEWTRVLPEMARADLAASAREVNAANQAWLAAKLIPGPPKQIRTYHNWMVTTTTWKERKKKRKKLLPLNLNLTVN